MTKTISKSSEMTETNAYSLWHLNDDTKEAYTNTLHMPSNKRINKQLMVQMTRATGHSDIE